MGHETGGSECRERLEAYLREHHVQFEVLEHPVAYTAQEVAAREHVSGWTVAKVVMVVADGALRMLVLPAPERVDHAKAKAVLGVGSVRLAREEEFATVFGDCEVGAMPPFGHLYSIPTCVDTDLARAERITFQAGSHTLTIRMRYEDYARLVRPTVADLSVEVGAV
jgi:Ala-tRNA(Pro) deacylase